MAFSSGLRAALIGFGQVAEKAHAPALRERGVQVVAIADGSLARRDAARSAFPDARPYASFDELLGNEPRLDFVDIATPPFLHSTQALAAVKAGLHVLCEKPLALALDELETLRRSAAMAGRSVFTVHNWAYSPQWRQAFSLVDSGAVGTVRHVELTALRTQPAASASPGDWRREASQAGGGILVDHGWHNLYLLNRLVRQKPNRVVAHLEPASGGVDEEATLFAEFPGATAMIHLSWRSPVRRNVAAIVGTKAVLDMQDDELVLRSAKGVERFAFEAALSSGSAHPAWFSAMLPDFLAEVADASRRGRNIEEAAFCLALIHRAYQAVRYGRNPARSALGNGGGR